MDLIVINKLTTENFMMIKVNFVIANKVKVISHFQDMIHKDITNNKNFLITLTNKKLKNVTVKN